MQSGYLQKKNGGSWIQRFATLNHENGCLSFFAEKNGKRLLKEKYNIHGGSLSQDESRRFTFVLVVSVPTKPDPEEVCFSALNETSFNQWWQALESSLGYNEDDYAESQHLDQDESGMVEDGNNEDEEVDTTTAQPTIARVRPVHDEIINEFLSSDSVEYIDESYGDGLDAGDYQHTNPNGVSGNFDEVQVNQDEVPVDHGDAENSWNIANNNLNLIESTQRIPNRLEPLQIEPHQPLVAQEETSPRSAMAARKMMLNAKRQSAAAAMETNDAGSSESIPVSVGITESPRRSENNINEELTQMRSPSSLLATSVLGGSRLSMAERKKLMGIRVNSESKSPVLSPSTQPFSPERPLALTIDSLAVSSPESSPSRSAFTSPRNADRNQSNLRINAELLSPDESTPHDDPEAIVAAKDMTLENHETSVETPKMFSMVNPMTKKIAVQLPDLLRSNNLPTNQPFSVINPGYQDGNASEPFTTESADETPAGDDHSNDADDDRSVSVANSTSTPNFGSASQQDIAGLLGQSDDAEDYQSCPTGKSAQSGYYASGDEDDNSVSSPAAYSLESPRGNTISPGNALGSETLSLSELRKQKVREERERARQEAEAEKERKEAEEAARLHEEEEKRKERWRQKEASRIARQQAQEAADKEHEKQKADKEAKKKEEEDKMKKAEDDSFEELMRIRAAKKEAEEAASKQKAGKLDSIKDNLSKMLDKRTIWRADSVQLDDWVVGEVNNDAKAASDPVQKSTEVSSKGASIANRAPTPASLASAAAAAVALRANRTANAEESSASGAPKLQSPRSTATAMLFSNPTDAVDATIPATGNVESSSSTPTEVSVVSSVAHCTFKLAIYKLIYPSPPLSRRLKLWGLTEGFIYKTPGEIDKAEFDKECEEFNDLLLSGSLGGLNINEIKDWNELVNNLRKKEKDADLATISNNVDKILLNCNLYLIPKPANLTPTGEIVRASIANTVLFCKNLIIDPDDSADLVATKINKQVPKIPLADLKPMVYELFAKKMSPHILGWEFMKKELTSVEEIIMFQEFDMDQWKAKFEASEQALKKALEEPPEDNSSPLRNRYLITNKAGVTHARRLLPPSRGVPGAEGYIPDSEFINDSHDLSNKDAKFTREEWRKWVDEKQQLIREHNVEKAKLLAELHVLRKAVSSDPNSREQLIEKELLARANVELEGNVVDSTIQAQSLREEVHSLEVKFDTTGRIWKSRFNALLHKIMQGDNLSPEELEDAMEFGRRGPEIDLQSSVESSSSNISPAATKTSSLSGSKSLSAPRRRAPSLSSIAAMPIDSATDALVSNRQPTIRSPNDRDAGAPEITLSSIATSLAEYRRTAPSNSYSSSGFRYFSNPNSSSETDRSPLSSFEKSSYVTPSDYRPATFADYRAPRISEYSQDTKPYSSNYQSFNQPSAGFESQLKSPTGQFQLSVQVPSIATNTDLVRSIDSGYAENEPVTASSSTSGPIDESAASGRSSRSRIQSVASYLASLAKMSDSAGSSNPANTSLTSPVASSNFGGDHGSSLGSAYNPSVYSSNIRATGSDIQSTVGADHRHRPDSKPNISNFVPTPVPMPVPMASTASSSTNRPILNQPSGSFDSMAPLQRHPTNSGNFIPNSMPGQYDSMSTSGPMGIPYGPTSSYDQSRWSSSPAAPSYSTMPSNLPTFGPSNSPHRPPSVMSNTGNAGNVVYQPYGASNLHPGYITRGPPSSNIPPGVFVNNGSVNAMSGPYPRPMPGYGPMTSGPRYGNPQMAGIMGFPGPPRGNTGPSYPPSPYMSRQAPPQMGPPSNSWTGPRGYGLQEPPN